MSISRREVLVGVGATAASVALPAKPQLLAGPLVEIATGAQLDALAAIWGVARYACGNTLLESDSSLRTRVVDVILRGKPRFVDQTLKEFADICV